MWFVIAIGAAVATRYSVDWTRYLDAAILMLALIKGTFDME